ncbi:MAG: hypothetical protein AAF466_14820 [Bacteroidota bacterium]
MTSHTQLSDHLFLDQFASAQLDPTLFDHEAHLRLAWLHIDRSDVDTAIHNISQQLIAYTRHLGAADKYNQTVTEAAIRAVYHFMLKSTSENFGEFMKEFPRLKTHFRELLGQHYGFNVFTSEEGKSSFIAPDLLPFD